MITTQDTSLLPDINQLRRLAQSLALLDAIIEPEWQYRYYSFNSQWNEGQQMASMRDGSGDGYHILFTSAGAIMKGFVIESAMNPFRTQPDAVWLGVLNAVPTEFSSFLAEPAFVLEETTFCIWRAYSDTSWQRGNIAFPAVDDPDGSAGLLSIFDGNPSTYQAWAEEYYERPVDLAVVTHIYEHRALTENIIQKLNPEFTIGELEEDLLEIGYRGELD